MDVRCGFLVEWENFQTNMASFWQQLWHDMILTDVTLVCEGRKFAAHKMVLSSCSNYFEKQIDETPSKHPIIIIKDVTFSSLLLILEYIYTGSVKLSGDQVDGFLKTSDRLEVKSFPAVQDVISNDINQ